MRDPQPADLFEISPEEACAIAVKKIGGPTAVATRFTERGHKISPQAVDKWKVVPARWARLLSELAEGEPSVYQLQPEVFGKAPPTAQAA